MSEMTRPDGSKWFTEDPAVAAYFAQVDLDPSSDPPLQVDTEVALERVRAALGMSPTRRHRSR
jgi:hypothetical protein